MNNLMILITVLLFTLQTICFKKFNQSFMKNMASYFAFNLFCCSINLAVFLVLSGGIRGCDANTLILGFIFGIIYIATVFCYTKAMETGPMSYSSLLFSFGLLVPIICGVLFWNESLGAVQLTGLALLFAAFYIGNGPSGESEKKISFKWAVYGGLTFLCNGSLGALTKWHQIMLPGKEVNEFFAVAFGTAALLSAAMFAFYGIGKKQTVEHLKSPGLGMVAAGAALSTAFGNQILMYLMGEIPAVVLFPINNGGIAVFSVIASVALFKEKLSFRGGMGLSLGVVSICLLSI